MPKDKYVYPYSPVEAKRLGELNEWRASYRLNVECAKAIDKAVCEVFDGMYLPDDIAKNACKEYGIDRVRWVLSNTIQHADWDGRYRSENKEWAKKTYIPRDKEHDNTFDFILKTHPELVNSIANQYRRFYDALGLFDSSHCEENSGDMDFTGRVLVLKPSVLRDDCKTPEDQLFFADVGGFGCKPGDHGKVMGRFLSDGEETNFHRDDFIGVLKDEHLPDWVASRMKPPIRCIKKLPGDDAYECSSSTYPLDLAKEVGAKKAFCNIAKSGEECANVYFDPRSEDAGEAYNCTIDGIDYYGSVLITKNGGSWDCSLSDEEISTYLEELNQSSCMTMQ